MQDFLELEVPDQVFKEVVTGLGRLAYLWIGPSIEALNLDYPVGFSLLPSWNGADYHRGSLGLSIFDFS